MLKFLVVTMGLLANSDGTIQDSHMEIVEVRTLQECKSRESLTQARYGDHIVSKMSVCKQEKEA